MADLTYTIEIALGGTLADPRNATTKIRAFTCSSGRADQFDTFNAGRCTFTIKDFTGDFVPGGGGLWSGETWIGREVRITVTSGGIPNVIWRGHVDSLDVNFVDRNHSELTVSAVEPIALLSRTLIDDGTNFSSELSSTRIDNVLALEEVDGGYFTAATKDITASDTTLQAESDASGNTLRYLQLVELSEGGRLFVRHGGDPGGVLAFRPRSGTSSDLGVTFTDTGTSDASLVDGGTAVTGAGSYSDTYSDEYEADGFTDTWDGGTAADSPVAALDGGDATSRFTVRLKGVDVGFGSDELINRVTYTRQGGTAQTAVDELGKSRYGIRATAQSGLLNATDADVLSLAQLRLARQSQPERNVESLSVLLSALPDDAAALVAALTVGDQVRVEADAPGTVGDQIDSTVRIEHVTHRVAPAAHTVEYRLTTLSDEFGGSVDGGTAATVSFVNTWDGGDATTQAFAGALDGGSAIFG